MSPPASGGEHRQSPPPPPWRLVEVAPGGEHRATVIWLHGLGADGHDFLGILPALGLPEALGVRFVFPEAPPRPVTINAGMVMRAWYDIETLAREGGANRSQLEASVAGLRALLDAERERGIPPERAVVAGFSQGGAVVLHAATTGSRGAPLRVGGVVALSAYLPFPEEVTTAAGPGPPIFQAHGTDDDLVPFRLGARTRDLLVAAGRTVEFHGYPIGHQISPAEIRDIGSFLRRVLGEDGAGP